MKNINGICKLTQTKGTFVKSHLLPRALTNLHKSQEPRIQVDFKGQTNIVHDSWYDYNLCTKDGEAILADLDAHGIEELREHNLIWDSWGFSNRLSAVTSTGLQLDSNEEGTRVIKFKDPLKIKIFFLSLLWRAAASNREEMEDVSIQKNDIENLRLIINNNRLDLIENFPIALVQLSTKGPIHNRTPYITEFEVELDGVKKTIKQARIYIDGLIIRITINSSNNDITFIDSEDGTSLIICKNFENSYQKSEMSDLSDLILNPDRLFEKNLINKAIDHLFKIFKK